MLVRLILKGRGHWACLLANACVLALAVSTANAADNSTNTDEARQKINALIEQLGDPSFIKREAARQELEKFGLLAFESLRGAELHENVEIAHAATYLLESMQVDWSVPTDSFEVQKLLKDYNEQTFSGKHEALQRLASEQRTDAYMALLRLMRYEKDETISKAAGLHVMESAIDALSNSSADPSSHRPASKVPWKELIAEGAAESTRVPAQWLQLLSSQLDSAVIPVETWQKHITQERMLLESNARSRSQTRTKTNDEIVKRLYRNVAKLMAFKGQQTEALEFFEPCFDLVSKEHKEAFNDLQWMLEAGLPQAVERLNEHRPDLFASRTRNRYLLAEAYLKLGKKELANKTAEQASDLSNLPPELARRIAQSHPADNEATQRHLNFDFLAQRGLFDWAEGELKRVLAKAEEKNQLSSQQEMTTRQRLANHYWGADQPEEAAGVWHPVMLRSGMLENANPDAAQKEFQSELNQRNFEGTQYSKYVPSHYYFYLGLAASKQEKWDEARKHLRKAAEYDASDPDLLIAMYRAVHGDQEFAELTDQLIEALERNYRVELEKAESELAMARNARSTYENVVAMQCNQLAWLLSCTNRKVSDAIMLSQRACNLEPDYAVYIDTLARCHFAARNVDKAIDLQTKAIKLMPFERSMHRQLDEFRQAKK